MIPKENLYLGNGDNPREECGLFGIIFKNNKFSEFITQITLTGLLTNQHRGEESSGICVADGNEIFPPIKKMGHVAELYKMILDENRELKGNGAISHTRYSTTGSSNLQNAAPFHFIDNKLGAIAIAHNGNITNAENLKNQLILKGCRFDSTTDSEVIGNLILASKGNSWEEKITTALQQLEGSFCLLILTKDSLYGVRDPIGNRPLSYAEFIKEGVVGYALSSETPAFDALGIHYQREVKPGEIIVFDKKGLKSIKYSKKQPSAFCGLEVAYLMRPDSRINKIQLDTIRRLLGSKLANNHPISKQIDFVTYIPESARSSAEGYSEELSKKYNRVIPVRSSLLKGRYGTINGAIRGFISPNKSSRNEVAQGNYFTFDWLKGKKVALIDDSIIRGTTTAGVVYALNNRVGYLRNCGVSEVHVRIIFPPVIAPCPLGTDINSNDFLIANELSDKKKIARFLTADSLEYLTVEDYKTVIQGVLGKDFGLCLGCATGVYPVTEFSTNKGIFEKC